MKVLITGVAGLLGSNFSRHLLQKNHKIIGIDDLSGGYADFIPDEVKHYKGDLFEEHFVNEVFEKEKPEKFYWDNKDKL
jgi:UDP-glucose 4-epimerase